MRKYLFTFIIYFSLIFFSNVSVTYASISEDNLEQFNPEDGIYTIAFAKSPNMVMGIQNNSTTNGANIQLCNADSTAAQHFAIFKDYDGWYTIRNIYSQCNLDVTNGITEPKTNLQQWAPHTLASQKFRFYKADNSAIYIQSKLGTFIDLANGNTTPGTNIHLFDFNGLFPQQWELLTVAESADSLTIADGNYYIISASNPDFTLDIDNISKTAGADLVLNKRKHAKSQIFQIKQCSDGWYIIKNLNSNLFLNLKIDDQTPAPHLQQWPGTGLNSQKFKFYSTENDNIIIKSKFELVLAAYPNASTPNLVLNLSAHADLSSESWTLKPYS